MALNAAAGYPQYSGTIVPNLLWAGKLLIKFYAATVLAAISNTDYEGEISKQGDTVRIRTTPTVTIRDYSKGQTLTAESPTPTTVDLQITKGKYWNFVADDVDKFQSDIAFIEDWTRDASEQLKIAINRDVLGVVYSSVAAANQGATAGAISAAYNMGVSGTPVAIDKTNVVDFITDMASVLSEQNVPEDSERFVVIPGWMKNLLQKSDLKNAMLTGDSVSPMRNGRIGEIAEMTVYSSNLLATTVDGSYTCTNIIAGHRSGLTFASQLLENESLRAESTFGTLFRGLQVYGYKVVKPESMVWGYVRKG